MLKRASVRAEPREERSKEKIGDNAERKEKTARTANGK